jgi:hypothetical protein
MAAEAKIPVYLEAGEKRTFACATDWPGWARVAKNDELALEALAAYGPRYAAVAREAGMTFLAEVGVADLKVMERVKGSATTDFGAPGSATKADRKAYGAKEARRSAKLVDAAWIILDRAVASAPAELRKGPRGGGRDRDKMFGHVLDAEASAYARKLGLRVPTPAIGDKQAIRAERDAVLGVLRQPYDGSQPEGKNWLPAYTARRIAWHALDHAWEMADRSD